MELCCCILHKVFTIVSWMSIKCAAISVFAYVDRVFSHIGMLVGSYLLFCSGKVWSFFWNTFLIWDNACNMDFWHLSGAWNLSFCCKWCAFGGGHLEEGVLATSASITWHLWYCQWHHFWLTSDNWKEVKYDFLVMWCQYWYHMTLISFSIVPFHLLGQDDQMKFNINCWSCDTNGNDITWCWE